MTDMFDINCARELVPTGILQNQTLSSLLKESRGLCFNSECFNSGWSFPTYFMKNFTGQSGSSENEHKTINSQLQNVFFNLFKFFVNFMVLYSPPFCVRHVHLHFTVNTFTQFLWGRTGHGNVGIPMEMRVNRLWVRGAKRLSAIFLFSQQIVNFSNINNKYLCFRTCGRLSQSLSMLPGPGGFCPIR